MTIKNVKQKHKKERLDFGPCKIPNLKNKGLTREEYTKPWQDNPLFGLIYSLYKNGKEGKKVYYKDIEKEIGWGWRTIKNKMNHILLKSILSASIKSKKMYVFDRTYKKRKHWYIDNKKVLDLGFEKLVSSVIHTFYKTDPNKPNKCEQFLLNLAKSLYSNDWEWNGGKLAQNRIGKLYPDLLDKKHKLIIEHYGTLFHTKEEQKERKKVLEGYGYKVLFFWEPELKDKNKCLIKIKKFVEENKNHAIPNI